MNNSPSEDRHYARRMGFEAGRRQLAARSAATQPVSGTGLSVELWICVVFALLANFVSRLFGWVLIFICLAFLLAIDSAARGKPAAGYRGHLIA